MRRCHPHLARGVVEESKARFSQLAGLGGGGGGAGGASGRSFHQDMILSNWNVRLEKMEYSEDLCFGSRKKSRGEEGCLHCE